MTAQPEILLTILTFVLLGTLPTWPYSRSWTYRPSAIAAGVIVILVALLRVGIL